MSTETYDYERMKKETYKCEKRPIKEAVVPTRWYDKYENRPVNMKRDLLIWKETYKYEKRPINTKRDLSKRLFPYSLVQQTC